MMLDTEAISVEGTSSFGRLGRTGRPRYELDVYRASTSISPCPFASRARRFVRDRMALSTESLFKTVHAVKHREHPGDFEDALDDRRHAEKKVESALASRLRDPSPR